MEPSCIFKGVTLVQSLMGYLGLIETVGGNVRKLIHQSLNAAIINIQNASRVSSRELQLQYIREARNKFSEACAVEENENKISSFVGLAMCQYLDDDLINARISLENAKQVKLTKSEMAKEALGHISIFGLLRSGYKLYKALKGDVPPDNISRELQFENYKKKITDLRID